MDATDKFFLDDRLRITTGDITIQKVDAIVNAANSQLAGGGGVDGAIHRAAGPELLAECKEISALLWPNGLPAGQSVITGGGRLYAKFVIHTVGPIYGRHNGEEPSLLAACYKSSLALAREKGCTSIAFPAISTGVFGYPREKAAVVVAEVLAGEIERHEMPAELRLVFFSERDTETFCKNARF